MTRKEQRGADSAEDGARERRPPVAFGPVPSRRLGRSIEINNVPPKVCSYSCIYCQVGATRSPQVEPRPMLAPEEVAAAVVAHVGRVQARGEAVDYLTFVPDGEPTLDAGLSRSIELLRPLRIPIAVISNASLAARRARPLLDGEGRPLSPQRSRRPPIPADPTRLLRALVTKPPTRRTRREDAGAGHGAVCVISS